MLKKYIGISFRESESVGGITELVKIVKRGQHTNRKTKRVSLQCHPQSFRHKREVDLFYLRVYLALNRSSKKWYKCCWVFFGRLIKYISIVQWP